MPIYEYACKACEHQFDALQKMSEPKLVDCPECGRPELRKLLSAPKFRLAGSGWYETDFKTDGKRNLAGDAADSPKKAAKDGDTKSTKADNSDSPKKAEATPKKDAAGSKASSA